LPRPQSILDRVRAELLSAPARDVAAHHRVAPKLCPARRTRDRKCARLRNKAHDMTMPPDAPHRYRSSCTANFEKETVTRPEETNQRSEIGIQKPSRSPRLNLTGEPCRFDDKNPASGRRSADYLLTPVSVNTLTTLRRALQNRLLLFLNFGRLTLSHLLLHMYSAQIIG